MTTERIIIDTIKIPDDLKRLDLKQLEQLAREIRLFLIKHVSENGGHLASNLGTVELTIALLRSFDVEKDAIIWDVGHQCYTYKILTGRAKQFDTVRKRDGISGFPKREESRYDYFNTGHSSTSVSAALGFARSARLKGEESTSIAVIGDGALTGGMAFEAMNDAGASGDRIIIIMNDNEMSISRNVGGIAEYFSRLRSIRLYSGANEKVRSNVEKIPLVGKFISVAVHRLKNAVKYLMSQGMIFEEMGLKYLGPVDGHDIKKLEKLMKDAAKVKGPVILHVVTKKGRGMKEAEMEPEKYHGIKANGGTKTCLVKSISFSEALGCHMADLFNRSKDVVSVCPAVAQGCGLDEFSISFKDRFFDVGIAEQHAVTMAAGMACRGMVPIVSSYSTFMQRAYDQILHDVCLMNLHVVFTLDRAGVVGYDGETHQGIYDLAYLSHMPNIKIYAPSDYRILGTMLNDAVFNENGPVAIRYPKGSGTTEFYDLHKSIESFAVCGDGKEVLIAAYGRMLGIIHEMMTDDDFPVGCSLLDISRIFPLDAVSMGKLSEDYNYLLFVEDVVFEGSCFQRFSSVCSTTTREKTKGIYVPDNSNVSGSMDEILYGIGMGKDDIIKKIRDLIDS